MDRTSPRRGFTISAGVERRLQLVFEGRPQRRARPCPDSQDRSDRPARGLVFDARLSDTRDLLFAPEPDAPMGYSAGPCRVVLLCDQASCVLTSR